MAELFASEVTVIAKAIPVAEGQVNTSRARKCYRDLRQRLEIFCQVDTFVRVVRCSSGFTWEVSGTGGAEPTPFLVIRERPQTRAPWSAFFHSV